MAGVRHRQAGKFQFFLHGSILKSKCTTLVWQRPKSLKNKKSSIAMYPVPESPLTAETTNCKFCQFSQTFLKSHLEPIVSPQFYLAIFPEVKLALELPDSCRHVRPTLDLNFECANPVTMLTKSKLSCLRTVGYLTVRSNQKVKQNGLLVENWGLEIAV